tara:strand:+ start:12570 stop:13484 length:915 start_codon:yes stop_codon:yes gene_type:complete
MAILLTGASGFLGSYLFKKLQAKYDVIGTYRSRLSDVGYRGVKIDVKPTTDWSSHLDNINCVVYCLGLAHVTNEGVDMLEQFRNVNCLSALNLAKQAASQGVDRFVYISSIGVNGLSTERPFKNNDECNPSESYAISKYEAELGLKQISKETGMEIVIIRPPLIYGKGAPGNFGKFIKLVKLGLPLPLGSLNNKRSLVGLDNLVDLISICIVHPKAANQVFLVSDDYDISTTELLELMIFSCGGRASLLSVHVNILKACAYIVGKKNIIDRMNSNLQIDISHTKNTLSWEPSVSVEEGIDRCFK